jgi:hypothetical protein
LTAYHSSRFIDGYTIRTLTLKGLILQDTAPPLDEISRFNAAGQAEADDMNVRSERSCRHTRTPATLSVVWLVLCCIRLQQTMSRNVLVLQLAGT